jgi:RNA polymerase sigma-70 factor (ECF subfamily)
MASSDELSEVEIPSSFEVFYREEYRSVLAIIYGLSGNRWVAEDLAQEAFLRVHRDWGRVAGMESPTGWVRRVAVNLVKSRGRRLRSEAAARLRLGPQSVSMGQPAEEFDEFWREVRRLPNRQAHVIALRYIDDLSVTEIARVLGVAEGTVKAQLHEGRNRLRRQYEAKGVLYEA